MNMTETFLPMALFALVTSATPGPVNVISAMSGARFGPISSLPYVFGATTSFVAILLLVGLGLNSVVAQVERFSTALTIGGSAYMLYLAWRIIIDKGDLDIDDMPSSRPSFRAGLLTQAINPKAWIVSFSAITIYVSPHFDRMQRLLVFSALFFLVCALSLSAWSVIGGRLARVIGNIAFFNRTMASLLAISIIAMLAEEFFPLF